MKKNDLIRLILLGSFVIIAYLPAFIIMAGRWSAHDTYYSHGPLVPLISIFIVWLKRKELSKLKITPSNTGWIFFILGIIIYIISGLWRVNFTSGFSLLLVLAGLVLLCLGKDFLRQLMFPILFLAFMIPLPEVAIVNISFRLKIFAAQVSTVLVRGMGVPALRQGSMIQTMHAQVMVEDPCSGIRSLIALIALGALMAYFSNISKAKKVVLFISSIPIAIGANIIRIVALILVSEMFGPKFALGKFHDAMGILVFVFAFIGLSLVGKILE